VEDLERDGLLLATEGVDADGLSQAVRRLVRHRHVGASGQDADVLDVLRGLCVRRAVQWKGTNSISERSMLFFARHFPTGNTTFASFFS
jgi:hypothetical protein